nr:hypothetical protein [Tanacetum cinerariifolium]
MLANNLLGEMTRYLLQMRSRTEEETKVHSLPLNQPLNSYGLAVDGRLVEKNGIGLVKMRERSDFMEWLWSLMLQRCEKCWMVFCVVFAP